MIPADISKWKWWYWAAIGGGAVFVVAVIATVLCCCCRRRRRKQTFVEGATGSSTGSGGRQIGAIPPAVAAPAGAPMAKRSKSISHSINEEGSGEFSVDSDQSFKTQEVLQLKKRGSAPMGKLLKRGRSRGSASISAHSHQSPSPSAKIRQSTSTVASPGASANRKSRKMGD